MPIRFKPNNRRNMFLFALLAGSLIFNLSIRSRNARPLKTVELSSDGGTGGCEMSSFFTRGDGTAGSCTYNMDLGKGKGQITAVVQVFLQSHGSVGANEDSLTTPRAQSDGRASGGLPKGLKDSDRYWVVRVNNLQANCKVGCDELTIPSAPIEKTYFFANRSEAGKFAEDLFRSEAGKIKNQIEREDRCLGEEEEKESSYSRFRRTSLPKQRMLACRVKRLRQWDRVDHAHAAEYYEANIRGELEDMVKSQSPQDKQVAQSIFSSLSLSGGTNSYIRDSLRELQVFSVYEAQAQNLLYQKQTMMMQASAIAQREQQLAALPANSPQKAQMAAELSNIKQKFALQQQRIDQQLDAIRGGWNQYYESQFPSTLQAYPNWGGFDYGGGLMADLAGYDQAMTQAYQEIVQRTWSQSAVAGNFGLQFPGGAGGSQFATGVGTGREARGTPMSATNSYSVAPRAGMGVAAAAATPASQQRRATAPPGPGALTQPNRTGPPAYGSAVANPAAAPTGAIN